MNMPAPCAAARASAVCTAIWYPNNGGTQFGDRAIFNSKGQHTSLTISFLCATSTLLASLWPDRCEDSAPGTQSPQRLHSD